MTTREYAETAYGIALIAGGLAALIGLRAILWPPRGGHRYSRAHRSRRMSAWRRPRVADGECGAGRQRQPAGQRARFARGQPVTRRWELPEAEPASTGLPSARGSGPSRSGLPGIRTVVAVQEAVLAGPPGLDSASAAVLAGPAGLGSASAVADPADLDATSPPAGAAGPEPAPAAAAGTAFVPAVATSDDPGSPDTGGAETAWAGPGPEEPPFEPAALDADAFDADAFEPAPFESAAFEVAAFEPLAFEPAAFEPAAFEAAAFEPAAFEPGVIEPGAFDVPAPAADPGWAGPPLQARVGHPRREVRRRRGVETELMPAISELTQLMPAVHGAPSAQPGAATRTDGPRRPRPRPRPRPEATWHGDGYGTRGGTAEASARSTVYVSRHAAEPA